MLVALKLKSTPFNGELSNNCVTSTTASVAVIVVWVFPTFVVAVIVFDELVWPNAVICTAFALLGLRAKAAPTPTASTLVSNRDFLIDLTLQTLSHSTLYVPHRLHHRSGLYRMRALRYGNWMVAGAGAGESALA